mmetsp:Transcript_46301/g.110199  ORF Transcript_46301/g.110199 Transcript_46301/m.110199 type:complete len:534 (+) Transcript_46301:148-1749(+)
MTSRESYSFLPPIEYVPVLYEADGYESPGSGGAMSGAVSEWSVAPERTWVDDLKLKLTDPESSRCAVILQDFMTGLVFISITNLMLSTVPEFIEDGWGFTFGVVEFFCTLAFTFEILLRVWASMDRWDYVTSTENLLDVLAAAPWYLEQLARLLLLQSSPLVLALPPILQRFRGVLKGERLVGCLQGLRVLRLLKAMRQFETVTLVLESIRGSFQGLAVLLTFVCFGTLISATMMYYLERDEPGTRITSIPAACWWSIATITGVGYGDYVPESAAGKLAASMFMVSGLLLTSVSVAIITSSFIEQFQRNQVMLRVQKKVERHHGDKSLVEAANAAVGPFAKLTSDNLAPPQGSGDPESPASPASVRQPAAPQAATVAPSAVLPTGTVESPAQSLSPSPLNSPRHSLVGIPHATPMSGGGGDNVMATLLRLEIELNEVLVVLETMANRVAEQDKELGTTRLGVLSVKDRVVSRRSSQIAAVGLLRNQLKGWFRHAEHVAETVVSKSADIEAEQQPRRGSAHSTRPRPKRQATFG